MIQYIWNVNCKFNIEWCYLICVGVWVVVIVIYFQKLIINITPNTTKSITMRLTRSQLTAIDQELLDFCLIEVPTFQHNFETLEAHVLTFALKRKFSTIIAVDKIDFENIVSNFLKQRFISPIFKRLWKIIILFSRRKLRCLPIVTKRSKHPL